MLRSLRLPHLTIRQKVLAGVVIPVLAFAVVGVVSLNSLIRLETTLTLMEMADDLSNTILEVRRYEKNYLLYGLPEDLDEDRRYLDESFKTLAVLTAEARDLRVSPQLDALGALLAQYRRGLDALAASGP